MAKEAHKRGPAKSPDEKARAIGALYASAELYDGELIPNFHAVSKVIGIDRTTLTRWWRRRDPAGDAQYRDAAAQARQASASRGAEEWYNAIIATIKERTTALMADSNRWDKADLDVAARALKTVAELALKIKDALAPKEAPVQAASTAPTPAETESTVQAHLAATGRRAVPVGDPDGDDYDPVDASR